MKIYQNHTVTLTKKKKPPELITELIKATLK